jgi:carboxymethylenebutenolidase
MFRSPRAGPFARRYALVGRALAALAVLACLAGPSRAAEVKTATSSFRAGGKPVRVDHFAPDRTGSRPAVLLLHGSTGLSGRDATAYRSTASLLANQGYVALLVHYFESTDTERVRPKDIDECLCRAWMGVVRGAVQHAAGLPGVDRERVGLVGFSLGACLALAAAGEEGGPRVAAVVDLLGCLPDQLAANAARLPPTLVLHGGADTVVRVEKARALEGLLRKHRRTFEIKVYDQQGHQFQGAGLFDRAVRDAQDRALGFLAKYLRRPEVARARWRRRPAPAVLARWCGSHSFSVG